LAYNSAPWVADEKAMYLMALDGVRFRKPVVPGDRLDLDVTLVKQKGSIWKLAGEASVDGAKVAEAELMATIADRREKPAASTP
jgi:3-hydroxyacyl-[acyl-carrier-protein] dehydratase